MAQEGHGLCAPAAALVIVDMISGFCFEDADAIREPAQTIAQSIRHLRDQADLARIPTLYVNDHFGQWHATPRDRDYFVIKPRF